MDLLLDLSDTYVMDGAYKSLATTLYANNVTAVDPALLLSRDYVPRQAVTTFLMLWIGGISLYFIFASISYYYFFVLNRHIYLPADKPQPKPGQISLACISAPVMALLTTPIILLEYQGYTKLYSDVSEYSIAYFLLSIVLFLIFTDSSIYWIHRLEHDIPLVYKYIHKPHHAWYVPTPYAAIAFHPVDGWVQSLPYHLFPFIFPLHKILYLGLFVFVQLWTISIHDNVDFKPGSVVNGALHHTYHHSKFNYNYGQFFTFWDQIGGTYLDPYKELAKELEAEKKAGQKGTKKQQ